ncbi:MAG: purine-binding chemotaxis protein CheW [Elusimicrobia bacterium]|nr:purine-binding chemotaxis protein CheW [Elusimicrobiota bacterium]
MADPIKSTLGAVSQWVIFNLGSEEFAVPAVQVQEIVRYPEVTHVPSMPRFVKGVINLRGKIVPIMDLKERFEIGGAAQALGTRRIIVALMGEHSVGLIVDSVTEVVRLPPEAVEPVPSALPRIEAEYLSGVGKIQDRLVVLLNLERLLSDMEKKILTDLKGASTEE